MKKIIIILIVVGVLLPNFSFGQGEEDESSSSPFAVAREGEETLPLLPPRFAREGEEPSTKMPETIEEAKELGKKALEVGEKELPGIIAKTWQEKILPVWQKMWHWFKTNIWSRVENWLRSEIEKRKEILKEGLEAEKKEIKEELKTEVPKTGQSWWEKFKELIK